MEHYHRSIRASRVRAAARLALAASVALAATPWARASTTATWTAPAGGNWTTPGNWSTNPTYPNNGSPVGATYDVTLGTGGTVTVDNNITVNTVSLGSAATLSVPGNTLSVIGAAGLALNGGKLVLGGGTVKDTLVDGSGGSGGVSNVISSGFPSTLNHVTLSNVSFLLSGQSSSNTVQLVNNLVLNNTTISLNNGGISNHQTLDFTSSDHLTGTGQIVFDGVGPEPHNHLRLGGAGLTIGSGITIHTGASSGEINDAFNSATVTNQGTISAQTAGQYIDVYNVANAGGTLQAINGGILNLEGSVSNATGAIVINNGTLNLGGVDTLSSLGNFTRTGGTVNYCGVMNDLPGQVVDLASTAAGPINFGGGAVINGGTLTSSSPTFTPKIDTFMAYMAGPAVQLNSVTLATTLAVAPGSAAKILNGLTLSGGGISLRGSSTAPNNLPNGAAAVQFSGSQTLGGNGTISFDGSSGIDSIGSTSGTLTVGPGITIRSGADGGAVGTYQGSLINQGTIDAQTPGKTLSIAAASWTNSGTLRADAGTLDLGGAFTTSSLGTVVRTGGTLQISGALDNTGSTLNLDATGPITLSNGSIRGGTIQGSASNPITIPYLTTNYDSGYIGGHATIAATINALPGSMLKFKDGVTLNNATINLNGAELYCFGPLTIDGTGQMVFTGIFPQTSASLHGTTFGAGVTVRNTHASDPGPVALYANDVVNNGTISSEVAGQTLFMSGYPTSFTNNGTMSGSNGGTLSLEYFSNAGTITASGGALILSSMSANTGTITVTNTAVTFGGTMPTSAITNFTRIGGTVTFAGTFNNAGHTFDLATVGPVLLQNAAINGGTVTSTLPGADLTVVQSTATSFDSITLAAPLTVGSDGRINVTNGLTLSGVTVVVNGTNSTSTTGTLLSFPSSQTLGGTGTIRFEGAGRVGTIASTSPNTLTIGPGITIATGPGGVGTVARANFQGQAAPGSGGLLTFATVNNTGTITAPTGTTVTFAPINNNGTVSTTGGTINLGGSFVIASIGNLTNAGGTINITGLLDNSGTTLSTDPTQNPWGLTQGGQITNGTVASPLNVLGNGSAGSKGGFLSNVTLNGATVTVQPAGALTVTTGIALASGAAIDLLGAPTSSPATLLKFASGATVAGTGMIRFDGTTNTNTIQPTGTLTLPAGVTVLTGTAGGTFVSATGNGLVNNGLLSAETASRTLSILTATFTNNATARAINGGILSITSANWSNAAAGVISVDGSTLTTAGAWSNAGAINVNNSTANLGGTFTSATLNSITFTGNYTLNLTGTVNNAGGALTLAGAAAGGTINVNGATISGGTLSLGGALAINWQSATLNGVTIDSATTLTLQPGSTLNMAGAWTNQGTIAAVAPGSGQTPATINLGGAFTSAGIGSIAAPGTTAVNITGTVDNSGGADTAKMLHLAAGNGSWKLANGAAINSGTIFTAAGQQLNVVGGFLNGVSLDAAGTIAVPTPASATWTGTWTNAGTINAAAGATLNFGANASSGATTTNTGSINAAAANVNVWGSLTTSGSMMAQSTVVNTVSSITVSGSTAELGKITGAGQTAVSSGASMAAKSIQQTQLTVNGNVALAAVTGPLANATVSTIPTLTFGAGGEFDLANNELITTTSLTTTRGWITGGLLTTSAAGGALGSIALNASQVEVRFTLFGDSNLDGYVDVTDLGSLASNYGRSTGGVWGGGDFDYNGTVDVTDLGDLASNYGGQLASAPSASLAVAAATAQVAAAADFGELGRAVPEPGGLLMLVLGMLALRRRRALSS